jgi:hypothetical protein
MEVSGQLYITYRFTPGTYWIGWVGPRIGLDAVEMRKILHWQESNPGRPARSPFTVQTELGEEEAAEKA